MKIFLKKCKSKYKHCCMYCDLHTTMFDDYVKKICVDCQEHEYYEIIKMEHNVEFEIHKEKCHEY